MTRGLPSFYDLLLSAINSRATSTMPTAPALAATPQTGTMPLPMAPGPPAPPPGLPMAPEMPASIPNAPIPETGGMAKGPPGILSKIWNQALRDPRIAMYMMAAGNQMTQPRMFGQSEVGHISNALMGGWQALAQNAAILNAMKMAQHEAWLKERETGVKERQVGAEETRAVTGAREVAQTGEFQRGQLANAAEANKIRSTEATAQMDYWKGQLDVAQKNAATAKVEADTRVKIYEDTKKNQAANAAAQAELHRMELSVQKARIAAAMAEVDVAKIKAQTAAVADQSEVKAIEWAYNQAKTEVAPALMQTNFLDLDVNALTKKIDERAQALLRTRRAAQPPPDPFARR